MRELGTSIDKIILTTDANYDPNLVNGGLGATESFRADATRFEAEDALLGTGVVASSDRGGFSGSGFANYPRTARTDAFVEWTVDVTTAGSYYLDFAYANGSNIDRAMELSVNNTVVQPTLSFGSTSAWNNWDMNSASVDLLAGTNTIKLTANSVRGPNIDYMELVQIPPAVV